MRLAHHLIRLLPLSGVAYLKAEKGRDASFSLHLIGTSTWQGVFLLSGIFIEYFFSCEF